MAGAQRILDPGETTHEPAGLRETQIRRHHPPIGPHSGTNQTVPSLRRHTGERERARKNTIESKKEKNMAETAQTMTEFTYAPGEKNIVGDRFSRA